MGALVERPIPAIFGGVSRQPDEVRRPTQVQDSENALHSVVTGGFEKRPPTQHLAALAGLDATVDYGVHSIDRDASEQTIILVARGEIHAFDAIDGSTITINTLDSDHYFHIESLGVDSTGVVQGVEEQIAFDSSETTFDWAFSQSDAAAVFKIEGSADGTTWNDLATGNTGASGTFSTTIGAVATDDHNYIRVNMTTAAGTSTDTLTVMATFKDRSYLLGADAEDFAFTPVADYAFLANRNITTRMGETDTGTIAGTTQVFSGLPAATGSGNIRRIQGNDVDNFASYYVIDDTVTSTWIETADPTIRNAFDLARMPYQLVRTAAGPFEFGPAAWEPRRVGDDVLVEEPAFVNREIQDVVFFRNRTGFIADETSYLGQAASAFDMWPEKAIDTLDSDPIERTASTTKVTLLKWATVFRKLLFVTAENAQFEMTSLDAFTNKTAAFDLATSYTASPIAKPKTMGDVLYFPTETSESSIIYEYFFDEGSLSNTAEDVTKHVQGYIPTQILQIETDVTSGTAFFLASNESNALYVYRVFFDQKEKLQSSWSKYTFGATTSEAFIHGIAVFSGFLVLVIERPGGIFLEQMSIDREDPDTSLGFTVHMDQRTILTGSYDSGTDLTTWTSPWEHDDDAIVVLGGGFTEAGRRPTLSYPSATTMTAVGDLSAAQCYVGRPYNKKVTLSKIYMRESIEGPAILNGTLTLLDMTFKYTETGYFKVTVTPEFRDPNVFQFEGRIVGSGNNIIGQAAIEDSGEFRVGVGGSGQDTLIVVENDTVLPSVITSLAWRGFFNEITRQE